MNFIKFVVVAEIIVQLSWKCWITRLIWNLENVVVEREVLNKIVLTSKKSTREDRTIESIAPLSCDLGLMRILVVHFAQSNRSILQGDGSVAYEFWHRQSLFHHFFWLEVMPTGVLAGFATFLFIFLLALVSSPSFGSSFSFFLLSIVILRLARVFCCPWSLQHWPRLTGFTFVAMLTVWLIGIVFDFRFILVHLAINRKSDGLNPQWYTLEIIKFWIDCGRLFVEYISGWILPKYMHYTIASTQEQHIIAVISTRNVESNKKTTEQLAFSCQHQSSSLPNMQQLCWHKVKLECLPVLWWMEEKNF